MKVQFSSVVPKFDCRKVVVQKFFTEASGIIVINFVMNRNFSATSPISRFGISETHQFQCRSFPLIRVGTFLHIGLSSLTLLYDPSTSIVFVSNDNWKRGAIVNSTSHSFLASSLDFIRELNLATISIRNPSGETTVSNSGLKVARMGLNCTYKY